MNNLTSLSRRRLFALSAIALIGVSSSGCVRLAANLVHAIKGNDVPAEFTGMQGKKVAVVCATDEGLGADGNSTLVARFVRKLLEEKVEKIEVSSDSDVDQWILGQKSDLRDYADIGKGLGVDYVIAVNMHNLTLKNGSTLHRGNCDLTVAVYDIKKDGKVAFRKHIGGFAYPSMAGTPTTDMDDTTFRRIYLSRVANRVARHFYPYEIGADVAADASMLAY